jgi:TolB-like protein/Flp pilus assembly protein TadD
VTALLSEFEYDVFISYRQNDNKYDGWVTKFVENLQKELEATIKVNISVYFDENPHDGLLDTHQVDETLAIKLKSLIFIPIVSQTYCDPNCFAWQHEFLAFKRMADEDTLGRFITLPNGNIASRILPVRIHKLDEEDQRLLEDELGGPVRAIDFVHEAPGINRPLDSKRDDTYDPDHKLIYRDQINKVANSIKEILVGIKNSQDKEERVEKKVTLVSPDALDDGKFSFKLFGKSLLRRNIPQVVLAYTALATIIYRIFSSIIIYNGLPSRLLSLAEILLIIGGIIALTLAWMYEIGPEGLIRTRSWESRLNPYPSYKRKPFTGLVTLSALVLILILQTFYADYFPSLTSPKNYNLKNKAIAVLPFKNLSEGGADDYFCDGLTADITTQLSKISDLIVIDPRAVGIYKVDTVSNDKIGTDLNVSTLLKGTYRRDGEKVRITSQLINIENSQIIWAEAFDRAWTNVQAIQSEVALAIAAFLEPELTDREKRSIEKEVTSSMTAYDHYLKGRNYYLHYEESYNDSAITEFKTAIRLDSNFTLAWAGLGDAYSQLHIRFGREEYWNDSSLNVATKAVHLDPNSAEANKALANACYSDKQYDRGFELLKKAVVLNPNYAAAVANLGIGYFYRGMLYESLIWQIRSSKLGPNKPVTMLNIGWTYRLLGDLEKAEDWLIKSINISPYRDAYRELAYCYVQQGDNKEALDLIPKVLSLESENSRIYEEAGLMALFANNLANAQVYFKKSVELNENVEQDANTIAPLALAYFNLNTDQHQNALSELERLEELYIDLINTGSDDDDLRIYMAGIKSMQGEQKEAVKWVERAIDSNWLDLAIVDHNPWFADLRSNPEYQNTINELRNNLINMRAKADKLTSISD